MIKRYEDLTMTDDFMFCKLLQNNPDISQELIELVTGKRIGGIVTADKQHPIEIIPDCKGVRLDVYLKDDKDTVYNIEMQTVKMDNIPKRARYYQSMIDVELIERGSMYKNLNDSYVIFFMLDDPFDKNLPIYTFENLCLEDMTTRMCDGTKKIYVNADGVRDILNPELEALLDYMRGHAPSSELTSRIDERVAQLKRNERWKGEFMTLYEHYQIEREEGRQLGLAQGFETGLAEGMAEGHEKGLAEGLAEGHEKGLAEGLAEGHEKGLAKGRAEAVETLMSSMNLSLEDACKALKITVEEYERMQQRVRPL